MEAINRTFQQFADLYRPMTRSQRATLLFVPLVLMGAFYFFLIQGGSSSYTALSWGKVFSSEEIIRAEEILIKAGLNDFERKGQRLMVPQAEVDRYNAALLEEGGLPDNSMIELEKQTAKWSIFTSTSQQSVMEDIARKKELERVIRSVPEIADATVFWARPKSNRWPRNRSRVTGNVSVRPQAGREISMQLVQSLRHAVAAAIPGLSPEHVTVMDQSTGIAHTPEKEGDPFNSGLIQRKAQFERIHQQTIAKALAYIPEVLVTVNVDLDNLKSSISREQSVNPKETVALQSSERIVNDSSSQQPSRAEPGQTSNRPESLQSAAGTARQRDLSDSTTSSTTAASFVVTEQQFQAAIPKAVQVSVGIPKTYYENVALSNGLVKGETDEEKQLFQDEVARIQTQVEKDVTEQAMRLIPATSTEDAVVVTSIDVVPTDDQPLEAPLTQKIGTAFSQWGGVIGLALFGIYALRMLNKSMPAAAPDEPDEPTPAMNLAVQTPQEPDEVEISTPDRDPDERDHLQGVVRDNPEMAAAVISKWIQSTNR